MYMFKDKNTSLKKISTHRANKKSKMYKTRNCSTFYQSQFICLQSCPVIHYEKKFTKLMSFGIN